MSRNKVLQFFSIFSFLLFIYLFFQQGKSSIWSEKSEEIIETEFRIESECEEETKSLFFTISFSIFQDFLDYFQTSLFKRYHGLCLDHSHSRLLNARYLFLQVFRL